ncbi:T9SS type A sorting domain-containing protein [bacterium]|nr:T9SS type A sorting domain-containing protein [bacterium]
MKTWNRAAIAFLLIFSVVLCAQPTKIAVVGNSITEGVGVGVPSRDSYPAQLGMYLGDQFEVGNFGVSGRTMLKNGDFPIWAEPLFEEGLNFDADILFILLGTNDSKPQNWDVYGNEFIGDYNAMIDSFSLGDKIPETWACLPPPAFSVQWGINDTVIVNEVIPAIEQVIADRGLNRVDFYTPFIGHNEFFPDDIHPNIAGANAMAKILYEVLTGDTIPILHDVNAAKNAGVEVSTGSDGAALTDNGPLTTWSFDTLPATATITLEAPETIDAFAVNFPASAELGIQFTIEGSLNGNEWTLLVDESGRTDTETPAVTGTIDPQSLQYFRLTVTGSSTPGSEIHITEFQAMAANGAHHAFTMSLVPDRESKTYKYYNLVFTPYYNAGEKMKLFRDAWDEKGFLQMTGYKGVEDKTDYRVSLKSGAAHSYYIMGYMDGVEVISDTIYADNIETSVKSRKRVQVPSNMELLSNYPNPFNPDTAIRYILHGMADITLNIYNSRGQLVRTFSNRNQPAGQHTVQFSGSGLESGIYMAALISENGIVTRKMLLLK